MDVYRYGNLICGRLLSRVNRFVCEVEIRGAATAPTLCYMANPGSMLGMCIKGAQLRLSESPVGSARKFKYAVEAIEINGTWIGCNTTIANRIVSSLLRQMYFKCVPSFPSYDTFRPEVKASESRFDFALDSSDLSRKSFVEVKTVTMASDWYEVELANPRAAGPFNRFPSASPVECSSNGEAKVALFPDCKSVRASKHARDLGEIAERGKNACVLIFLVMRDDVSAVSPSAYCDAEYTAFLRDAVSRGLQCIGVKCKIDVSDPLNGLIKIVDTVPCLLPIPQQSGTYGSVRKRRKH